MDFPVPFSPKGEEEEQKPKLLSVPVESPLQKSAMYALNQNHLLSSEKLACEGDMYL